MYSHWKIVLRELIHLCRYNSWIIVALRLTTILNRKLIPYLSLHCIYTITYSILLTYIYLYSTYTVLILISNLIYIHIGLCTILILILTLYLYHYL